jgi:hypothetical protein
MVLMNSERASNAESVMTWYYSFWLVVRLIPDLTLLRVTVPWRMIYLAIATMLKLLLVHILEIKILEIKVDDVDVHGLNRSFGEQIVDGLARDGELSVTVVGTLSTW